MRIRFDLFGKTVALCFLLIALSVFTTYDEILYLGDESDFNLVAHIESCFDENSIGFADTSYGISTLESTLDAIELLTHYTDRADWSPRLMDMLRRIGNRYISLQSNIRSGFIIEGKENPSLRESSLIVQTLVLLGRNDFDIPLARNYIKSVFRNSLTREKLLTADSDDLEDIYWALELANELSKYDAKGLDGLGLRYYTIKDIHNSIANDSSTELVEKILIWGEHRFEISYKNTKLK